MPAGSKGQGGWATVRSHHHWFSHLAAHLNHQGSFEKKKNKTHGLSPIPRCSDLISLGLETEQGYFLGACYPRFSHNQGTLVLVAVIPWEGLRCEHKLAQGVSCTIQGKKNRLFLFLSLSTCCCAFFFPPEIQSQRICELKSNPETTKYDIFICRYGIG